MANRNFSRVQALQKEIKIIEGSVVIGATGAVGTVLGLGVDSITRNATGNYTITLEDAYNRLVGLSTFFSGTTESAVFSVQVDDATPQASIKSKDIILQCYDAAGSDVDPAQTVLMHFSLLLRNSSLGQTDE